MKVSLKSIKCILILHLVSVRKIPSTRHSFQAEHFRPKLSFVLVVVAASEAPICPKWEVGAASSSLLIFRCLISVWNKLYWSDYLFFLEVFAPNAHRQTMWNILDPQGWKTTLIFHWLINDFAYIISLYSPGGSGTEYILENIFAPVNRIPAYIVISQPRQYTE